MTIFRQMLEQELGKQPWDPPALQSQAEKAGPAEKIDSWRWIRQIRKDWCHINQEMWCCKGGVIISLECYWDRPGDGGKWGVHRFGNMEATVSLIRAISMETFIKGTPFNSNKETTRGEEIETFLETAVHECIGSSWELEGGGVQTVNLQRLWVVSGEVICGCAIQPVLQWNGNNEWSQQIL